MIQYRKAIQEIPPEDLVFLDESGAAQDLVHPYGYSLRGTRRPGEKPTARGKRISTLGAINTQGLCAALCFEGTCNTEVFVYFLEQELLPRLKPGSCLVMDNATPHKNQRVFDACQRWGVQILYLPPYSPELNPIELCWATVKHFMKKLRPRGLEPLYHAWSLGLKLIDSSLAKQCIQHCLLMT